MKLTKFKNLLDSIPSCTAYYRTVPTGTSLPFLVWYVDKTENFGADNTVFNHQADINVVLYTDHKDFSMEEAIESVFRKNQIFWDSYETMLDDEATIVVTYEIQLNIES